MINVELIYDRDCPNVASTRAHLIRAFANAGLAPKWTEWDRGDLGSPPYVTGYGSPTILVNGQDVAEAPPAFGVSCRLYDDGSDTLRGTPSVQAISAALVNVVSSPPRTALRGPRGGWRASLGTLPGLVASILPAGVCPACWPVYAGVLSAIGLGFLMEGAYLLPFTAALLLIAVASLAFRARSRRGYGPSAVGLVASILVSAGKFRLSSDLATYGGIVLLVIASLWNAWPRFSADTDVAACPACAPDGQSPHSIHPGA
jgi:hypothetical protein